MTNERLLLPSEQSELLQLAVTETHARGTVLQKAGDTSNTFYLVVEGEISIQPVASSGNPALLERRGPGDFAGVLAFFSGAAQPGDLRCSSDCLLAVISRELFESLLQDHPALWRKLEEAGLLEMRKTQLANHLDRLFGPFGAMMPHILKDLEQDIEWLTLKSGETLFEQGDHSNGACILMTGRLQMATALPDGTETLHGTVVPGETVGEVALLTGQAEAHTVFAARDSELVRLSNQSFELLLQRNTRAIYNVSRILGGRLAQGPVSRDPSRMPIRCICLIPGTPGMDLTDLAGKLKACLNEFGPTLHLHSAMIGEVLDAADIAQAEKQEAAGLRLTQWLSDQEEQWRYLLYQGDTHWSPWSARCVRQADEVVVVADAAGTPGPGDFADRLSGQRQRWSLVLLHPPGLDRPRNTGSWLAGTNADAVFHVRRDHLDDLQRLGRILTGNAVGLVLGGGGARGFAHLGVLRAMEELDIRVDMIGGTSMGAPIAGFVAQGSQGEELSLRARQAYRKIIDFTLPVVSLIAGERISNSIREQTGDWDIEDYWLPFFCVATNLTTGQPVVHRRGSSWLAIRSSVSIPGVLPPLPSGDALLVDGAVLNNIPIDIMRELNPFGTVIAVDVTAPAGPPARSDYGAGLSGWKHLANRILPWRQAPAVPGIASTILQATVAGSAFKRQQMLEQELADLYLNINLESVGLLQFDAQDEAAQLGYDGAIGPLRDWARLKRSP